jgi:sugar lactone lactonase YvrE
VADTYNHRVQVFSHDGTFQFKWGTQGNGDGQFDTPSSIVVDGFGRVYVADFQNQRVQVFSGDGTFLRKWGSQGRGDGQFRDPIGIAVDGSGRVYIADRTNHRVQVFSNDGTFLRKWGKQGTGDSQFQEPWGIAVNGSGRVYVADTYNHRVQVFNANGAFLGNWGCPRSGDDQVNVHFPGTKLPPDAWGSLGTGYGQFNTPSGITVDGSGRVYVTDRGNHRVQVFDVNGAFLGTGGGVFGTGDGQFKDPFGIAVDRSGRVYVVDLNNNRVQVFSLTPAETVTPRLTPTPFEPCTEVGQQAGGTQGEQNMPGGFNLTVSIGGEGTGGVQVGAGRAGSFECQEAQCLYKSVQAMLVTVVAMPNQGSEFQGWSVADQPGVCSGTGSCQITMDRDVTVIATFTQP